MRILATADLHFNHPRSRKLACELIQRMNQAGGDVLLLVGDSAAGDPPALEQCLERFDFAGPKLLVAGNHELWTLGDDSYRLFRQELPRRVEQMGWQWLQTRPLVLGSTAIVGSIGWYDYSFAPADLGVPVRFFERKISPGSAAARAETADLVARSDDIAPQAMDIFARWNDGKFVKLGRSDEQFLGELLAELDGQLSDLSVATALPAAKRVVAAVHHLPFAQLLPPRSSHQWDFARAFLGSARLGEVLLRYPTVSHVLCGHSHLPAEAQVEHLRAINIGSGYGWKTYLTLDLPD